MRVVVYLAALAFFFGHSHGAEIQASANPIRKVVNLLQMMVKKVSEEGEKEEELFNKFQCYCKTGGGQLASAIQAAEAKMPELTSAIEESTSRKTQLADDLVAAKSDREAAKTAMGKATSIREKEAGAYAKYKAEQEADIAAMGNAVAALEKGMAGSFLQTALSQSLKSIIALNKVISDLDRRDVMAFLQGGTADGYSPQSGQIVGIVKQLKERTEQDLADATADENQGIKDYEGLMAAKKKEVATLTAAIESKTKRLGEVAVEIVGLKDDLGDTGKTYEEDKKFLADLESNCKSKAAEWAAIQKTRAEELVALHETIKVLNDDDALDLFKNTLPGASASFVQIQETEKQLRSRALNYIKSAKQSAVSPKQLDFIALALHGKKVSFDKVLSMIDEMVSVLGEEQSSDDEKKTYCEAALDTADDKKKALERKSSDEGAAIEDAKESIATLASEIEALSAGIKALDKDVAEATENRKAEAKEFSELIASDTGAKKLLEFAKNRLNKFYNPKLYKTTTAPPLSEEDQVVVAMGGDLGPTAAPGGIAGTGISAFVQIRAHEQKADPGAAPGGFTGYKKKGQESNGVIAMIDLLKADLDKEMTQAKTDEENAQAEYEQTMADSKDKRALDSKSLADKAGRKAETEAKLEEYSESKRATERELMATVEAISALHGECDWLLKYFDARKEARAAEVDSLKNAKAVLSGADYSLLQNSRSLRK